MDGFNERTNYIHNANDKNRLNNQRTITHDSSFAQMKVKENSANVKTFENVHSDYVEEAKGAKENFVLRNYNLNNFNKHSENNPVKSAMDRNRFKKF